MHAVIREPVLKKMGGKKVTFRKLKNERRSLLFRKEKKKFSKRKKEKTETGQAEHR